MKTCLFCGSGYFDQEENCTTCHHSRINGRIKGEKVEGYIRRELHCPSYVGHFLVILIPAIMTFLIGLMLMAGQLAGSMDFLPVPELENCWLMAIIAMIIGGLLSAFGIKRMLREKKAYNVFYEVMSTSEEPVNDINIQDYYDYEEKGTRYSFLYLLLPNLFYIFLLIFIYYADTYASIYLMDTFMIVMPDFDGYDLFKGVMYFFPIASMLLHAIDIIYSLVSLTKIKNNISVSLSLNYDFSVSAKQGQADGDLEKNVASEDKVISSSPESKDPVPANPVIPKGSLRNLHVIDAMMTGKEEEPCGEMSLTDLCARLKVCLYHQGVDMADEQVIGLISSIAANRLLMLQVPDECQNGVMKAISECFGTDFYADDVSGMETEKDLLYTTKDGSTEESEYLCGLYAAHYTPSHLCVLGLKGVNSALVSSMSFHAEYAKKPEKEYTLPLVDHFMGTIPKKAVAQADMETYTAKVSLKMPANVWCFLSPNEPKIGIPCDKMHVGAAMNAVIHCEKSDRPEMDRELEGQPVSYRYFNDLVRSAGEKTFLPEDQWKKFDKLEEFLNSRIGFTFGNRLYRKIETYTDVYLGCGGDVNHAIDFVLTNVLTSVLAECDITQLKAEDGRMSLFELMDKTFGSDNISMCHGLLAAYGLEN